MKYRAEIDGLRALAVVPVILFHAGFGVVTGGFVGVDVFFVISGYLITSILLSDIASNEFSLSTFYERRARRILPALIVMMVSTIPFAWMWLMPNDMEIYLQSLAAVSVFMSNLLFWSQGGYFDTAAELKPLLHTWSLAVEEQYYILFPLFLLAVHRLGRRWLLSLLVAIALISLFWAHWNAEYPDWRDHFFLLSTRGWEILVGALVAMYFGTAEKISLSKNTNQLASGIGMLLIIYSIFFFDANTPYPSLYTLIPTLGAALLIIGAQEGTLVNFILKQKLLVGIGLISYSAYLWHQPLFAFARHRNLSDSGMNIMFALILATFFLAFFSWKYVEQPFRGKSVIGARGVFSAAALSIGGFIIFGIVGHIDNGFSGRHDIASVAINVKRVKDVYCHNSGQRSIEALAANDFCTGGGEKISMAVIGDSHAGMLFDELDRIFKKKEIGFIAVSKGYCPPIYNFELLDYSHGCRETVNLVLEKIVNDHRIDVVVLGAEWGLYSHGYRDQLTPSRVRYGDEESLSPEDNPRLFSVALNKTVDILRAAGKKVMIVEPVPEFKESVVRYLERHRLFGDKKSHPVMSLMDYKERNKTVFSVFDRLLDKAQFVRVKNIFCDATVCHSVDSNGDIDFSDTNHVTDYGARKIATAIAAVLH